VALIGRVPVKVSTENGAIEPGDYLTSSTKPGVAMKATQAGPVIGKALEVYNNSDPNQVGKILVFVNLTWYGGKSSEIMINPDGTVGETSTINDANFASNLIAGVRQLGVDIVDGVIKATKLVVNEVKTKLFRVAVEENKDNVVGTATIPAQQIEVRVNNSLVEDNSQIFITFRNDLGTKSWHLSEIVSGVGFTIRLSDVTPEPLTFNYWIVLIDGEGASQTSLAPQTEPYCGDVIINAAETCDDGNSVSGDGCSAGCIVETPQEEPTTEPIPTSEEVGTPTESVGAEPVTEPLPAVAPAGAEEGVVPTEPIISEPPAIIE
jgi:cysteine-rich repeat protein